MGTQRQSQTKTTGIVLTPQATSQKFRAADHAIAPLARERQAKPKFRGLSHELANSPSSPIIQAKLTIGQPDDRYEREADRIASDVVAKINAPTLTNAQRSAAAQRQVSLESMDGLIQRRSAIEADNATPDLESSIQSARGSGQPLADNIRKPMEQAFGADFSSVKVHTDSQSDQLNQSIQAKAFTTGQDVFFRQGAYEPSSRGGQELIAHELTHTIQQRGNSKTQAKSDVIQRLDTVQRAGDDVFDYGGGLSEASLNTKVVLKKKKALYKEKGGTEKIKDLLKGSFVEVLEKPSSKDIFSKSWAKVKKEGVGEGWINTKNAVDAPESGKIAEHESAGVIMPNGVPTVDDVKQMMFGDCFLLATLISLVQRQPDFIKDELFETVPTEDLPQHTVRFFKVEKATSSSVPPHYGCFDPVTNSKFTPEKVTVDNTVLKFKTKIETPSVTVEAGTNVGSAGAQAWPAVVEKAFAQWPGKNKTGFSQTDLMAGGQIYQASMFLKGEGYKDVSIHNSGMGEDRRAKIASGLATTDKEAEKLVLKDNRDKLKADIIANFTQGSDKLIGAGTDDTPSDEWLASNAADGVGGSGESKVGGIAFGHAYAIVNADNDKIYLRNPWGRYSRVNGKVEENEAVSILTWDEFYQVFSSVSMGV